jgi:branched-chain amino acid transport system permease protein
MAIATDTGVAAAAKGPDIGSAVKDAAMAALVAVGLFGLLIGFETRQTLTNEIVLVPRPVALSVMVAIVFFGRLAMSLFFWQRGAAPVARPKTRAGWLVSLEANAGPVFLLLALAFPITAILIAGGLQPSRYWVDLGILLLTYVMLGWGLNIVVGLAGLLDLGYVAFYAVGAYSYALIATTLVSLPGFQWLGPWMFFVCLPLAGVLAALWGVLLGFPVLRLRGDYLAIVTLAFGEIIRLVLINWSNVTGGGAGISSIPRPTFFGIPFTAGDEGFATRFGLEFDPMHRVLFLYYVILVLCAITYIVTLRLRRLPVGRAWEALREDETACRSLGINTVNTKLTAFAIGAMFGGFAGCFFAARQGFISPESFTFMESAIILAIVVLGGMGSMLGVIIATLVLIGGPEMLRNIDFLKEIFGQDFDPTKYRMILLGLGMVLIMIWKPRGLISTREPTAFLKERKRVSGDLVKEGHG